MNYSSEDTLKVYSNLSCVCNCVGSISAALSFLVCVPPRGRNAGSFPEQRLVIEPSNCDDQS